MSEHSPINSYDQLYTPSIVAQISLESRDSPSPTAYLDSWGGKYQNQAIYMKVLEPMAQWAEPGDPVFGKDPELPAEKAFRRGGVLGLRAAHLCGGLALLQTMPRISPLQAPARTLAESQSFDVRQGSVYMSLGISEHDSAEPFQHLLNDLTPRIVSAQSKNVFFASGFGLMAYYARRAIELQDAEKMAEQSFSPADFDALLGRTE